MYDKIEVIDRIGWQNWELFEEFIVGRVIEYDENDFEMYHPQDVADFMDDYDINL